MHSASPAISVLMTMFNAGPYLASSMESITKQTFSDWEFIIVDDASTDGSLAIAESHARKDPRIKIIRNTVNKGQTRCLNQGLAEARGALVARQDADDLSHPERLEKQWKRFEQDPSLALLGTCGEMINHQGKLVGLLDVPLTHEVIAWSAAIINPFLHTSVMFRAAVVQALRGYDERYQIAQDYDFWTRIIRHYRVANLPDRLISYRHLESSLSKSKKNKAFEEADAIATREEKNSFGRELQVQEHAFIRAFREGAEIKQRAAFSKLWKQLQLSLDGSLKEVLVDQQRLEALRHLQSAGSYSSRLTQLNELIAAFLAAPFYTLRWLKSRYSLIFFF